MFPRGSYRHLARVCLSKVNDKLRYEVSRQLCTPWVMPRRNHNLARILAPVLYPPDYSDEYDEEDMIDDDEDDDDDEEEEDEEGDDDMGEEPQNGSQQPLGQLASEPLTALQQRILSTHQHPNVALSSSAQGQTLSPFALSNSRRMNADSQQSPNSDQRPKSQGQQNESAWQARGRRRLRSDSNDSLRQQGEERGSPRNYPQLNSPISARVAGEPIQSPSDPSGTYTSIWHTEDDSGPNVAAALASGTQSMATAFDQARERIAEFIATPISSENYRPHSYAPGAFPSHESGSQAFNHLEKHENPNHDLEAAEMYSQDENGGRSGLLDEIVNSNTSRGRIDWFMLFDLALWKEVRSGFRELYMATMMLDPDYKIRIAIAFARNYPNICRSFLDKDRSPEHSVLLFSVQLFPAQTITDTLVREYRFLFSILEVLHKFFLIPTPPALRQPGFVLCDTEPFRNRRYFHAFHDMRYLVATPVVSNWVANEHEFLLHYIDFIKLFQGMNTIRRASTQHVEFESDDWINAFNVTLQVAKSCRQYAECFNDKTRTTLLAVRTILREMYNTATYMAEENFNYYISQAQAQGDLFDYPDINKPHQAGPPEKINYKIATRIAPTGIQYPIVDYDISQYPVSFHHPLHWFMTQFLQHAKSFDDKIAKQYGFVDMQELIFSALDPSYDKLLSPKNDPSSPSRFGLPFFDREKSKADLLRPLDYSVRVCALMAQVQADFWVRNGRTLKIQANHYQDVSLRENTYDQDVSLIQFYFCAWDDTDHILMTLVERFNLQQWISLVSHNGTPYDPMQLIRVVEEFLNLLINIISERHVITGCTAMQLARREVIHAAIEPLPFSVITKRIPERLALLTDFDSVVNKHATFTEPANNSMAGKYELKDEFLDEVDPYFAHYQRNDRENVEEVLWKRLKARAKRLDDESTIPTVLLPKLIPIKEGIFTTLQLILHTPLACQIIFYSLVNSSMISQNISSEIIVDEALQLIIVALEDAKSPHILAKLGTEENIRGGIWYYSYRLVLQLTQTQRYNLIAVLVILYHRQNMKQWKPKLEYIIRRLREGGRDINDMIDQYFELVTKNVDNQDADVERKKQLAKMRQAQIMAELESQQKSFFGPIWRRPW